MIRDEIPLHSVPYSFMASKNDGLHPPARTSTRPPPAARASRDDCERELEKALAALLKSRAPRSVILDIRDNPGGLLDQAFAVSNLFLKKGQLVVFTRGRTRRDESNYITEAESPFADAAARGARPRATAPAPRRSWPAPSRTTTAG